MTTVLSAADVRNGYCISAPGYYTLEESVELLMDPRGVGTMAGIVIDSSDVTLDLGGNWIGQSDTSAKRDRFFTIIQLASSPFPSGKGPADFGDTRTFSNLVIRNGTLGRSSHFGIHGQETVDTVIEDLEIRDFEVAGISLNAPQNVTIRRVTVPTIFRGPRPDFETSQVLILAELVRRALLDTGRVYPEWDEEIEARIAASVEHNLTNVTEGSAAYGIAIHGKAGGAGPLIRYPSSDPARSVNISNVSVGYIELKSPLVAITGCPVVGSRSSEAGSYGQGSGVTQRGPIRDVVNTDTSRLRLDIHTFIMALPSYLTPSIQTAQRNTVSDVDTSERSRPRTTFSSGAVQNCCAFSRAEGTRGFTSHDVDGMGHTLTATAGILVQDTVGLTMDNVCCMHPVLDSNAMMAERVLVSATVDAEFTNIMRAPTVVNVPLAPAMRSAEDPCCPVSWGRPPCHTGGPCDCSVNSSQTFVISAVNQGLMPDGLRLPFTSASSYVATFDDQPCSLHVTRNDCISCGNTVVPPGRGYPSGRPVVPLVLNGDCCSDDIE